MITYALKNKLLQDDLIILDYICDHANTVLHAWEILNLCDISDNQKLRIQMNAIFHEEK